MSKKENESYKKDMEEIKDMMSTLAKESEDGTFFGIPLTDIENIETDLAKRREQENKQRVDERWSSYSLETRYGLTRFQDYNMDVLDICKKYNKQLLKLEKDLIEKYKKKIKYKKDIMKDRKFIMENRTNKEPVLRQQRQELDKYAEFYVKAHEIKEIR